MTVRVDLHTAASICGVQPGTIRKWSRDGRLTVEYRWDPRVSRTTCWYDADELLRWIDARDPDALYSRLGLSPADRPADTRHVHRAATSPGLSVS